VSEGATKKQPADELLLAMLPQGPPASSDALEMLPAAH